MMKKLSKIFEYIIDIPITLYFNFYYLTFKQAIKLPISVTHKISIHNMGKRGCIKILNSTYRCIKLGKTGSFSLATGDKFYWSIAENAEIIFEGKTVLGRGTQVICGTKAIIVFGENFYCNSMCIINSSRRLSFGRDVLIGWKTELLTSDGHEVYDMYEGDSHKENSEIVIGNHCWIASNVTILKGTRISNDSIVATKACISKKFEQNNILIGGFNKIIKTNVNWKL